MNGLKSYVTRYAIGLDKAGVDTMEVSFLLEWFENKYFASDSDQDSARIAAELVATGPAIDELESVQDWSSSSLRDFLEGYVALLDSGPVIRGQDWMDVEELLLDAYMDAGLE